MKSTDRRECWGAARNTGTFLKLLVWLTNPLKTPLLSTLKSAGSHTHVSRCKRRAPLMRCLQLPSFLRMLKWLYLKLSEWMQWIYWIPDTIENPVCNLGPLQYRYNVGHCKKKVRELVRIKYRRPLLANCTWSSPGVTAPGDWLQGTALCTALAQAQVAVWP